MFVLTSMSFSVMTSRGQSEFTTKGGTLYAIQLGVPEADARIASLGFATGPYARPIGSITLLGSDEQTAWTQTGDALVIEPPKRPPNHVALVYRILPGT